MGCVFLVSVVVGRPMVERLALEFWPLTPEMLARPAVLRLLRGLTFLWAAVNLLIGVTTLALLLWLPLAVYVAAKQFASLGIMGLASPSPSTWRSAPRGARACWRAPRAPPIVDRGVVDLTVAV